MDQWVHLRCPACGDTPIIRHASETYGWGDSEPSRVDYTYECPRSNEHIPSEWVPGRAQ